MVFLDIELVFMVFKVGVYGEPLLQGCDRYVYDTSRLLDIPVTSCITPLCPERPLYRPIIAVLRVHNDRIPLLRNKELLSRVFCLRYPLHASVTRDQVSLYIYIESV